MSAEFRREHDLLGWLDVPHGAYYGVHTVRASLNFPISGVSIGLYRHLVVALASVKEAAATTNRELGLLDGPRAEAIMAACREIRSGKLHEQFIVDVVQGGAGTSTNMNANEVIANRALELMGAERGQYDLLHPLDHVNLGQSTNDVYPTALRVGLYRSAEDLLNAMAGLRRSFAAKAEEFAGYLKMGRTQLQDAVPMTLGQEFKTFAVMMAEDEQRLREAMELISEVNLGGTAIGTGLNSHVDYARLACQHLATISGVEVIPAGDLIEATQDVGGLVQLHSVLKRIAVKLSKVANDLRLLSSGPRAGFGEIQLPPVQAGSSIMPGKVNPVIPEVVNQVAYSVVGNDITITMAAESGQLQLNAFEPIMARALFSSLRELRSACTVLAERCVDGITADPVALLTSVEQSIGLVTALVPYLGYRSATEVAQEAMATGASVVDVVRGQGLMSESALDAVLGTPHLLTAPGLQAYQNMR
ncbi:aspartate ammonia-lyase [Paenarthrobacter sp. PH39-S1]|uniref:aspartate ammonia-lyase n=1 Tax=Paenarthrobacter sp. PH39-S1 TaxID=3046204 RepID=UPI0024B9EB65|nr:aspartate ammonia-lyase [Paenarthrobacter sp. PH39-S1]MDJ0357510.1 aspartate ammonia-lyase [Paenarthrobacter sp. PH39-S1]